MMALRIFAVLCSLAVRPPRSLELEVLLFFFAQKTKREGKRRREEKRERGRGEERGRTYEVVG